MGPIRTIHPVIVCRLCISNAYSVFPESSRDGGCNTPEGVFGTNIREGRLCDLYDGRVFFMDTRNSAFLAESNNGYPTWEVAHVHWDCSFCD